MGAVKGTNVKDLCELVGGMAEGDTLQIKASDGFKKEYAYKAFTSTRIMKVPWWSAGIKTGSTG